MSGETQNHQQHAGPYIAFHDVSKAFGDHVVLDHVSFHVMPGETLCILGRSGVGKSVSLHHIMGFLKPAPGEPSMFEELFAERERERKRGK